MKGKLASGKAKSKIENCCPPAPAPEARERRRPRAGSRPVIKNQPQALGGRGGSWVRAPYVALNVKHKQGVTLYLKRIRYHAGGGEAAPGRRTLALIHNAKARWQRRTPHGTHGVGVQGATLHARSAGQVTVLTRRRRMQEDGEERTSMNGACEKTAPSRGSDGGGGD